MSRKSAAVALLALSLSASLPLAAAPQAPVREPGLRDDGPAIVRFVRNAVRKVFGQSYQITIPKP